jgi:hypothetical protein
MKFFLDLPEAKQKQEELKNLIVQKYGNLTYDKSSNGLIGHNGSFIDIYIYEQYYLAITHELFEKLFKRFKYKIYSRNYYYNNRLLILEKKKNKRIKDKIMNEIIFCGMVNLKGSFFYRFKMNGSLIYVSINQMNNYIDYFATNERYEICQFLKDILDEKEEK